jgi:large subunit ribosomal protein L6
MSDLIVSKSIEIPQLVEVQLTGVGVTVKGPLGNSFQSIDTNKIKIDINSNDLIIQAVNVSRQARAMVGTFKTLILNMIEGVTRGFEKKLLVVGVGYRVQISGNALSMNLGFSHPISYPIPENIKIETPSPTEILIKGTNKQRVGQVAAEIRRYRSPEPYKGKGIRYSDERIVIKETKKK